ncbi:class I lanthipeptide [Kordia sp.]|uniref:class I lanthipeptide n=1 Tax=Kordia sp. TaxID=1965332 RepID=UPI003B596115
MKKKRSIQKLAVHKETISNLNKVTGGDVTTSWGRTIRIIKKVTSAYTHCESCTCEPFTTN